jgi:uncharacterized protein
VGRAKHLGAAADPVQYAKMSVSQELEHIRATSSDPHNPSAIELATIVENVRTIAVVGMSRDPAKAARRVPSYMAANGHNVIPVNPFAGRILGKVARASLSEVQRPLDLVLVFRPSSEAGGVIDQAASRPERPVIWLPEGIRSDPEANAARTAGLHVIQDLCMYKVHRAVHRR